MCSSHPVERSSASSLSGVRDLLSVGSSFSSFNDESCSQDEEETLISISFPLDAERFAIRENLWAKIKLGW